MKNEKKAIFLDRDGTLIEEVNFLSTAGQTRLFDHTAEALTLFRDSGFSLFVVTNQSGVARGFFDVGAVDEVHSKIRNELVLRGLRIESFEYCPHLPDAGCACRKPNTGMIERIRREYSIDLEQSWVIGDKLLDIQLGRNAGCRTALVLTGYGSSHRAQLEQMPDIIAANLLEAAMRIVEPGAEDRDPGRH